MWRWSRFPVLPFPGTPKSEPENGEYCSSVTLPDLNISVSRFYPFKRKRMVGKERWYEKISMSYTGSLRNSIDTKEDMIMKSNLVKDWRNGMQHSIPINANFTLFT